MARSAKVRPARDRLLVVATRLFAEHGFNGTPVSRIVREAKVTMPVLYYHFGSKIDLLFAVLKVRGQWLRGDLAIDPARGFDAVCAALVDHAVNHIDELSEGLRLRVQLGFETGPEVANLRAFVEAQRAISLEVVSRLFTESLPGASSRRCAWLAEVYLSGVQGLALELIGVNRREHLLPPKGVLLVRSLAGIAALPENELPG